LENSRNCENWFIGLSRKIGEEEVFTLIVYFTSRTEDEQA